MSAFIGNQCQVDPDGNKMILPKATKNLVKNKNLTMMSTQEQILI